MPVDTGGLVRPLVCSQDAPLFPMESEEGPPVLGLLFPGRPVRKQDLDGSPPVPHWKGTVSGGKVSSGTRRRGHRVIPFWHSSKAVWKMTIPSLAVAFSEIPCSPRF